MGKYGEITRKMFMKTWKMLCGGKKGHLCLNRENTGLKINPEYAHTEKWKYGKHKFP